MNAMTKPGWGAIVEADKLDLEDWMDALKEGFEPWIEVHAGKTVLRSSLFDELTSQESVRDCSVAYIDRLNGAFAVLRHTQPARFGGVVRFAPDGKLHHYLSVEVRAKGRRRAEGESVSGPDDSLNPASLQQSSVQSWIEISHKKKSLDDALVHFGKGRDWFDMYKTIECLYKSKGGKSSFLKLNWEPPDQIEWAKYTANWFRHARRKYEQPGRDLMTREETRAIVERLLRRALNEAKG